jgi:hypothetical protein
LKIAEISRPRKIMVVLHDLNQILNEATKTTVGKFTARRDQPHFEGDEYHAHANIRVATRWHGQSAVRADTKENFRPQFLTMPASP